MRELINAWHHSLGMVLILLFLVTLPSHATQRDNAKEEATFARIYCDNNRLIEGDSCLISFVIYSTSPFSMVEAPSKIKIKNGHLRPCPLYRQRLQRVREHGRIYYALLVEEYVIHTKAIGNLVIFPRHYTVNLSMQQDYADPFDSFFAPPRKKHQIRLKGHSEKFILPVVKKPMRTTRQMMRSGLEVI